jgi:hypothetical protein
MEKRETTLLGAFLVIGGGLLLLGSSLRAVDYLLQADSSPAARWLASVLLNWPVAIIVLLLGFTLAVKAYKMPQVGSITTTAQNHRLKSDVRLLSATILPIDPSFQLTDSSSPARAVILKFRNEPSRTQRVAPLVGTRALVEVRVSGGTPLHARGFWMDEKSAFVNFGVGDMHDLLLAVCVEQETSIVDVVATNDDLRTWNVSAEKVLDVRISLVGGIEDRIVREFSFELTVRPHLGIRPVGDLR